MRDRLKRGAILLRHCRIKCCALAGLRAVGLLKALVLIGCFAALLSAELRPSFAQSSECESQQIASLIQKFAPTTKAPLSVFLVRAETVDAKDFSDISGALNALNSRGGSPIGKVDLAEARSTGEVEQLYLGRSKTLDEFVIVDSIFQSGESPKYNDLLTSNRNSKFDEHTVVTVDSFPKIPDKAVVVQVSSSRQPQRVALLVEAVSALVLWPALASSDDFMQYMSQLTSGEHGQDEPTPGLWATRDKLIVNCMLSNAK
ncbi:hypothetical protein [Dongia sedimenti]|uniref:FtsX extracellular domain-containing protein n=1 Tax=Dongia sedimenti TaxID=3064282 RepID=A0ABU0YGM4_9PROT|nr:hypothetical protein [Rhodospirillaceae bacterium R-7]